MSGAVDSNQDRPGEDRRMWRLLLAHLHPDAGGDHELFLFASGLRERADEASLPKRAVRDGDKSGPEHDPEPFLQEWRSSMSCWASRNHEALKSFVLGEISSPK